MDRELRFQLLRACCRDKVFLAKSWRDVDAKYFGEREESVIIKAAISFWELYREPIGALLSSNVMDLVKEGKYNVESKKKVKDLIEKIQHGKIDLVSVTALSDRVKTLKRAAFFDNALEELIIDHEKGKLSAARLAVLVERAQKELAGSAVETFDFKEDYQKRIDQRRHRLTERPNPLFLIEPLDKRIKGLGRGQFAIYLAPYNSGKGLALVWTGMAYALQGLKVLHITLEDDAEEVGNRLDACITGIPLDRLARQPNRFKKRFRKLSKHIRGHIKIVDGTEGGWTVSRIEKTWEDLHKSGFTADVIIVDYDDEIECEEAFKGESARRMEFAHIYRRLRRMAARLDVFLWSAAQGTRGSEGKKTISGKDAAEDISKIRKTSLAIGIGVHPKLENVKHLYVMRNRFGRARFGVNIASDFASAIFYDRDNQRAVDAFKDE